LVEPPVAPALPVHSVLFYFCLAFGLASAFSIGVAFTADRFDPTIRTPLEAHGLMEAPVLAWLPESEFPTMGQVNSRPRRRKVVVS
jgi:capsular polysaccharide biosynthesis protein